MAQSNQSQDQKTGKRDRHTIRGKRERHTVKNQVTINLKGEIVHKPQHSPGCKNDYAILKIKHPVLSDQIWCFMTLGI